MPTPEISKEKGLLQDFINGDPAARDAFVDKYTNLIYSAVHATIRRFCADRLKCDVDDIHNEIFLSLIKDDCRKLRQYRGLNNCSVASWLKVISINHSINFIKRSREFIPLDGSGDGRMALSEILADSSKSPLDDLIMTERYKLFESLMRELDPNDIQFLEYFYRNGLTPGEIAKKMKTTISAVYCRKSRIKEKLRRRIQKISAEQERLPQGVS